MLLEYLEMNATRIWDVRERIINEVEIPRKMGTRGEGKREGSEQKKRYLREIHYSCRMEMADSWVTLALLLCSLPAPPLFSSLKSRSAARVKVTLGIDDKNSKCQHNLHFTKIIFP